MSSTRPLSTVEHFVGIDISKQWVDCWLRPAGEWRRCESSPEGFRRIDQWLRAHGASPATTIICMEHAGIYDDRLLKALTEFGWRCALEKTTALQKVTPEHHRKDDAYDAAGLAEYADRYLDKLHLWEQPDQQIDLLRQLYAERRRLVTQRAAIRSKQTQATQHVVTSELLQQSWTAQLRFLNEQIDQIESRMSQIIDTHPGLAAYRELLVGIPGVGKVTAWLWLILFFGQEHLNPKKIASRFGFAPHSRRSGSSVRGKTRSSGHGLGEMRSTMTLVARSASTHEQRFKEYKQRKLEEGKPWPVVCNNLINKMITIICAIWNSGQAYDANHTSRFDRQKTAA